MPTRKSRGSSGPTQATRGFSQKTSETTEHSYCDPEAATRSCPRSIKLRLDMESEWKNLLEYLITMAVARLENHFSQHASYRASCKHHFLSWNRETTCQQRGETTSSPTLRIGI